MPAHIASSNRPNHRTARVLAALSAALAASAAFAQVQPNQTPTPPPVRRPLPPPATNAQLHPQLPNTGANIGGAAPTAPGRNIWNSLVPGNNANQNAPGGANANRNPWNPLTQPNAAGNARTPAATNPQARANTTPQVNTNTAPSRTPARTPPANTRGGNDLRMAATNPAQTLAAARTVPSRTFVGHPGPPGSREAQARNGTIVRTAADGSVLDVRSPRNGMSIHHGLDGSRRITVEQPDHSRIFASSRGVQYVQHPYNFRGATFDHRTFYVQGKLFHQFYRPYTYAGTSMDVYAPSRFYRPEFYQWANSRFNAPAPFTWTYTTTSTPWYSYYKGYFQPESSYSTPQLWLTDFVLASSLAAAYATEPPKGQPPAATGAAPVTPEVKQMVADEVGRQVQQESVEAKDNAANRQPRPGAGGVVEELGDRQPHAFVVAADLDLVNPDGRRCMVSAGDVVQVVSPPDTGTSTAEAIVMWSKGGVECERSARVEVAVADLQEMQNHMRETIDQGMASTEAGKKAPSVTAAFAQSAPPPDANAAREIDQQQQIAAAAEG